MNARSDRGFTASGTVTSPKFSPCEASFDRPENPPEKHHWHERHQPEDHQTKRPNGEHEHHGECADEREEVPADHDSEVAPTDCADDRVKHAKIVGD